MSNRLRRAWDALRGLEPASGPTAITARKSAPTDWNTTSPGLGAFFAGAASSVADLNRHERELGPPWLGVPAMACLGWLADNFGQADLVVYESSPDPATPDRIIPDHPVQALLDRVEGMTRDELWALFVASHKFWGESFFLIVETLFGEPARLLWVPPQTPHTPQWNMLPVGTSDQLIDRYEYRINGRLVETFPPERVIYIRDLPDPQNPRRGMSRFRAGLRAAVGHNRADDLAASLFGHTTVSKVFIPDQSYLIDEPQAEGIRSAHDDAVSMRGRLPIMQVAGRFEDVGRDPSSLGLDVLPDRFERSICALLGVQASTVGLSGGQDSRTYANDQNADRKSWQMGLTPCQNRLAIGLTRGLLRRIDPDPRRYLGFDRSRVDALKDDQTAAIERGVKVFAGKLATRNEGRDLAGLPPLKDDDLGDAFDGEPAAPPPLTPNHTQPHPTTPNSNATGTTPPMPEDSTDANANADT